MAFGVGDLGPAIAAAVIGFFVCTQNVSAAP